MSIIQVNLQTNITIMIFCLYDNFEFNNSLEFARTVPPFFESAMYLLILKQQAQI